MAIGIPPDRTYTRDEWLNLSLTERCEINRPAYEALGKGMVIETDFGDGCWLTSYLMSLFYHSRIRLEPSNV